MSSVAGARHKPAPATGCGIASSEFRPDHGCMIATARRQGMVVTPRSVWSRLCVWETVVGLAVFLLLVLNHSRQLTSDSYVALAAGRQIWSHGIPTTNTMTLVSAGRAWIDQQWLGQLLLYGTWRAGGYAAVTVVNGGLTALAFVIVYHLMAMRGASAGRALKWTTLAVAGTMVDVSPRTQDGAYVLFAFLLLLVMLDDGRPSRRWAAAALGLLVLWANVHGSVLVGIGVLAWHCAVRAVRVQDGLIRLRYITVGALAPLTIFVTPYGADIIGYYRSVLGNGAIRDYSAEWQPALPPSPASVGVLCVLAAVTAAVVIAWRRGVVPDLELGGMSIVLAVAALASVRWGAWASMVGVVLAADLLNRAQPATRTDGRPRAAVVAAGAGLVVVVVVVLTGASAVAFTNEAPQGAIQVATRYALAHPQARVLADDRSASALLWQSPALAGRVSMDGRLEIYPQQDVRRWAAYILARPGSVGLARGYQVLVASTGNAALCDELRGLDRARVIYDGSDGLVVVRAPPATA